MARKKRKKNLNQQLKKHRKKLGSQNDLSSRLDEEVAESVATSVIDTEVPSESDVLSPTIAESKTEEVEGLETAESVVSETLEAPDITEWQDEGNAEAETDAAVADGADKARPQETLGEASSPKSKTETPVESVVTSVIDEGVPSESDILSPDISESKAEEVEGLETAESVVSETLEAPDITEWQDEGNVEAETDAAVADGADKGSPEETVGEVKTEPKTEAPVESVTTSVIDKEVPSEGDVLSPDITESKTEEVEGLETAESVISETLEAPDVTEWQDEGNAEAETNAAVADGADKASPTETVGEASSVEPKTETPVESVTTSVIDTEVPSESDVLSPDISESKVEEKEGLETAESVVSETLEEPDITEWQDEGNAEAETDAAVADGADKARPEKTAGEEDLIESMATPIDDLRALLSDNGILDDTSVIPKSAAPSEDDLLDADIPESATEEKAGLTTAESVVSETLEAPDITEWQDEGNVEAETDAAVADGADKAHPEATVGEAKTEPKTEKPVESVATSVIDKEVPNESDVLSSDITESKTEEVAGLETAESVVSETLEEPDITQWQDEGNAEAETDAAVADGATAPHPQETAGEEETDPRKRVPHNHPIEKELPIYLL